MLNKNQKIKLILLYKKGEITGEQLKTVSKLGFPAPIFFESENKSEYEKEVESVRHIYKMFGQQITGITFETKEPC